MVTMVIGGKGVHQAIHTTLLSNCKEGGTILVAILLQEMGEGGVKKPSPLLFLEVLGMCLWSY